MVGIPATLATRQDWLHVFDYVQSMDNAELKGEFRLRLQALKKTRWMKVLKDGVDKPAEDQTPDDYEDAIDPASPFAMSGLAEGELDQMIGDLQ